MEKLLVTFQLEKYLIPLNTQTTSLLLSKHFQEKRNVKFKLIFLEIGSYL